MIPRQQPSDLNVRDLLRLAGYLIIMLAAAYAGVFILQKFDFKRIENSARHQVQPARAQIHFDEGQDLTALNQTQKNSQGDYQLDADDPRFARIPVSRAIDLWPLSDSRGHK